MGSLAIVALSVGATAVAAADVTAVPGAESGRVDAEDQDSGLRIAGRALLSVPRVAVMLVTAPVRAAMFAFEHYEIQPRLARLFFTKDGVVGLYPTGQISSDYGLTLGARFVHRDLFGAREQLSIRAQRGGRYRGRARLTVRSGDRFGERVALELTGEIDRRPKERFFGIGNLDDPPEVRHRQELARATGLLDVRAVGALHVRAAGSISEIDYGRSTKGPPIDEVYSPRELPGFDGARMIYGELELRWDDRRSARGHDHPLVLSTGDLASAFIGRAQRLDTDDAFWRYGVDLQHFLRLGAAPRVLVGRFHGEGVTGERDAVPFTELPQLGGRVLLRGYSLERFRDRVAAVGTVEYRWDLSYRFTGALFVDVGRVFPSLSDLSVDEMRVGYGIGLEYNTRTSFIGHVSLASSIDGGVFVNLGFDPVFDMDTRVERR